MSTITQILWTDVQSTTRAYINDNFNNLNTDKADKVVNLSQFASTTSAQFASVISDETGTWSVVFATSPTLITPVIDSINLWHATDTTLARVSAWVISVEWVTVPTISSTNTLTNKRVSKRVVVTTQSATPTINTDNGDIFQITGLAQAITSMTTNLSWTPVAWDMIMIQITDNGSARAITWWASFASTTVNLPTTTVISTMLRVLFQRNNANTAWDCIATG